MLRLAVLLGFVGLVATGCTFHGGGGDAGAEGSGDGKLLDESTGGTGKADSGPATSQGGAAGISTGADGGDSTAAAPAGACGWGPTGQKVVTMGYICGGDGEDPAGLLPRDCPSSVELVVGGSCGGNMGVTGAGCCDAEGNIWFCASDGNSPTPTLYREEC